MPIGNGDLGMNLWTEENGDVVFLIGKTDAWNENSQLIKLGRVRIHLDPSPFAKGGPFRQVLNPKTGDITIIGAHATTLRAWVDINAPVIHLEVSGNQPMAVQANVELWRTEARRVEQSADELKRGMRELSSLPEGFVTIDPDTMLAPQNNTLAWVHHNTRSIYPSLISTQHLEALLPTFATDPLLHRNSGVMLKGTDLVSVDDRTLRSRQELSGFRLDAYALVNHSKRIEDWQTALKTVIATTEQTTIDAARTATSMWWKQFWERSWINVSGDDSARAVTQGYAMQRWMLASCGRGPIPAKFNGGIFTVGQEPTPGTPYDPAKGWAQGPDYRAWGSNFWFQNQRHLYWPMIAAGDLDTLSPFYQMYENALPLAKARTRLIYQHGGVMFPETMYYWGLPNNNDFGWGNAKTELKNTWIRWHYNNGLELITMLLDTYASTQDADFAKKTLMPLAIEWITFFDQHAKRLAGKLHYEPAAALETRQNAVNPTQDLAGLMHVLPRLIALPKTLTTAEQRAQWQKLLTEIPPLPRGRTDNNEKQPEQAEHMMPTGTPILLPAEKFSRTNNCENPELYAVFPFRIFGINLPELELARATYNARRFVSSTCWGQDGIEVACLGWADRAKYEVIANFTAFGGERFKWFWKPGHDWEPDLDNGGAGQIALQHMLMQVRDDKVLLFPAWPKSWNVDFKLHAPHKTVIEGIFRNGAVEKLTITPTAHRTNVTVLNAQ
jgi:hypothetical protein